MEIEEYCRNTGFLSTDDTGTKHPVLTHRTVRLPQYNAPVPRLAMAYHSLSTQQVSSAICLRGCSAKSGTVTAYAPTCLLHNVRYSERIRSYLPATRRPHTALRHHPTPGTNLLCAIQTRQPPLPSQLLLSPRRLLLSPHSSKPPVQQPQKQRALCYSRGYLERTSTPICSPTSLRLLRLC